MHQRWGLRHNDGPDGLHHAAASRRTAGVTHIAAPWLVTFMGKRVPHAYRATRMSTSRHRAPTGAQIIFSVPPAPFGGPSPPAHHASHLLPHAAHHTPRRQLGYQDGLAVSGNGRASDGATYPFPRGPPSMRVWLHAVGCTATQQRLDSCENGGWGNTPCSHRCVGRGGVCGLWGVGCGMRDGRVRSGRGVGCSHVRGQRGVTHDLCFSSTRVQPYV